MHCDRKEKVEENIEQRNFFFLEPLNLVTGFREKRVFYEFHKNIKLLAPV